MVLELYTQPFCAPCVRARQVVRRVAELVPALEVREVDVVAQWQLGRELGISSTPVIRLLDEDRQLLRAESAPTVDQLLAAVAEHL